MSSGLPTWGETAKGVKIIDGDGNPAGTVDNPVLVQAYSPLALTVGQARLASSIGRSIVSNLPLTLNIAGNHPTSPLTDVLSVVATSRGAAATDVAGAISWRELR